MKIGVIGHLKHAIAKPYAGGLESFTHSYIRALVDRGHDVTLFASGDSDPALPLDPIVPTATIAESRRRLGRVHTPWVECVEDEAYESLMVRLAAADFDVIHNHSLSPIPLRFASIQPTRMITTLHTPVLPRMQSELESRGSENCGEFVNISEANAAVWRHWIPNQRIIHNGVDTRFWKNCCAPKQRRAIWFGRILPDKGTHLAIAAAQRAGLPIDIVGPIADQDYFDAEVSPKLSPSCVYLGHKTHEELCELVSRAAVALVTPCWDEPFGLVVAEALACGTPVAAFARGALPELITPSVGRLAAPGDVPALAAATRDALCLAGEVCRRVAQEKYSFDRMVSHYETLYRRHQLGVAI
ncbi:glycosyl transferase, group 1 family protein [Rhodopirellula maiorica SM1]|uniref:Glycosyl transferase, group 1 family protein n=1 Tax=Rhodopirellula maiorica SM1 TaxID=1265738 RepID=M5R8I1_9BACT|nr:glycosyltransferase family 4 protein [Rhodopirellula maiorica]EMI15778.1 glycosyl transferase, group 1 family protein [Rhodopirellula maiorica SM1]